MMDESLKKSIKNGLISGGIFAFITFFYGGIYNSFILGRDELILSNIVLILAGTIFSGIMFFTPVFIVSLIVYYFKDKKPVEVTHNE